MRCDIPIYTYRCPDGHSFDMSVSFADADKPIRCPQPPRGAGQAVKVLCCGDTIQSMHQHDFVECRCGNTHIDGGDAYLKMGMRTPVETRPADGKRCGKRCKRDEVYRDQAAHFNAPGFTRSSV